MRIRLITEVVNNFWNRLSFAVDVIFVKKKKNKNNVSEENLKLTQTIAIFRAFRTLNTFR